jgi:outer membrane usher protein
VSRRPIACGSRWPPTLVASTPRSTWPRSALAVLVCAIVAVLAAGPAAAQTPLAELLLQVDINRQGLNETVLVLRAGERFLISAEDLARWRLREPDAPALMHEGRAYFPLDALPGVSFELDERRQRLAISTSAQAFAETVSPLPGPGIGPAPLLPQPGAFLNYTVSASRASSETATGALFEAGFFSRYGVLTSSAVAATLERTADWHRLDTTYTIDYPQRRASLRFGDAVTRAGAWGRAVRFGGAQFGTNFGTQPGFIPFPVTAALGQAALPSTVDVFVNNALVTRRSVPPGPFAITDIPVVTGSGDVRVVVRDLLGREQIYTQPFYGSTTLFRKGISDYSFEAGAVREDFGIASDHYSEHVAAATYRAGITDRLTGEARAEHSASSAAGGVSAAFLAADLAVLSATGALSSSDAGTGGLLGFGFERGTRLYSLAFQNTVTGRAFRQSGMLHGELPRRRQTVANTGLQLGALGSFSLTHIVQDFRDQPKVEVATLAYSFPLGRLGQLGISAVRTLGPTGGSAVFVTLALPLGEAVSASASLERVHANDTGTTETRRTLVAQKSPPLGEGYGFRVQARDKDLYGSWTQQTRVGIYTAEAATADEGGTATRLTASGGVGTLGGHVFLSRSITDSFAVVRVADFPNVRVLHDNQPAARTDAGGYAVLPRLRAYDRNPITVEQTDLPFDARITALALQAVPYFRSGVFLDFPVRRVRAATFRVVLEDGTDLPSGALARIAGKDEAFPVALRGEAYVEGLEARNRVTITWRGQSCELDVSYPPNADPLPDLGTFLCKGVKP